MRAVTITPFRNAAQLRWLPPLNSGGGLDRYDIVLNECDRVITIDSRGDLSSGGFATIEGLENGREYRVAITAWNPAGAGSVADTAVVEPVTAVDPLPGEPLRFTPSDAYLSVGATGSEALLLDDGRVLVAGYVAFDLFDPVAERFSDGGSLPGGGRSHSAVLLGDGRVLLIGGCCSEDGEAFARVDIYDPTLGRLEPASPLPRPSLGFSSMPLPDGRVLITGGRLRTQPFVRIADTYYFDPAGGGWTRGPDLSVPRDGHTATLLPDGRVLVAGGVNRPALEPVVPDLEILDPASNSVAIVGALDQARRFHAAIALANGTIVIIGGTGGAQGSTDEVELFDPVSQTLATVPDFDSPPAASAIVLDGSRLFVVGLRAGNRPVAGILDLGTGTFEEIDPPQIPVWFPLLTRLADGRILVLGGASFNVAQGFAEIYDPLSGEFHLVR